LKGLFLVDISKSGSDGTTSIPAVEKTQTISEGDTLLFAGDVSKVKDIWNIKGLEPTNQQQAAVDAPPTRSFVEVVIHPKSPLVGKTAGEIHFRGKYNASILSVYRDGAALRTKVGTVVIEGGDTLLLLCKTSKIDDLKRSTDFITLAEPDGGGPVKINYFLLFVALLANAVMISFDAAEIGDLLTLALMASYVCLMAGCLTVRQAVDCIPIRLIIVIAASFAMATALNVTGVAAEIAANLTSLTEPIGPIGLLYGIYLATVLLTALLSNGAAAALMIPIIFALTFDTISVKAYVYAVMLGASADFSTPIGYQTNLMVWGPGGYKFYDFPRYGIPLQIILSFVTVGLCYLIYGTVSE